MPRAQMTQPGRRGFTLTEVMVVIGLIVVLLAILLPALSAVRTQGIMANSMSNLRQVAAFMQVYSSDNRDTVLPSQFDYSSGDFQQKGRVRSELPPAIATFPGYDTGTVEHQGTWADILWHVNGLTVNTGDPVIDSPYRFCAPDRFIYESDSGYRDSPFRSMALNSRDFMPDATSYGDGPKPYGSGATEAGLPGFFAANDFFNARPDAPDYEGMAPPATGRWYGMGQVRSPARSLYLVDSFAGAVIAPEAEPFDNAVDSGTGYRSIEVDFRYSGNALIMFLDGHIDPAAPWNDLESLQSSGIRVQNLDRR